MGSEMNEYESPIVQSFGGVGDGFQGRRFNRLAKRKGDKGDPDDEECSDSDAEVAALNLATLAIANLGSDFSSAGIEALLPGNAGFEGATGAYNRRFTFAPFAVAYPKSAEEVSKVVMMGGGNGMKVVARSVG
ncbi:hypothetical protein PQX77_020817, partial [Marasmius sp. AFHP31]